MCGVEDDPPAVPKVPRLASRLSAARAKGISPGDSAVPQQVASALAKVQAPLIASSEEMTADFMDDNKSKLPKQVRTRVRFKCYGHGQRIRDCDFCGCSCNAPDLIFTASLHIWNHLEADAVTVQGSQCFWCAGTHCQFDPGFNAHQLK